MAKQLKCKFHKYNAADKSYDDLLPQTSGDQIINFTKILVDTVYPVGSIFQTTTEDDPNTLWPGTTWEKMEAGRVLISAGTYTEGEGDAAQTYTYNLGDKGGEAKHQLTTEELASHGHVITNTNLYGELGFGAWCDLKKHASGIVSRRSEGNYSGTNGQGGQDYIINQINASHGHIVQNAGQDQKHENRQPYVVVNQWKRID